MFMFKDRESGFVNMTVSTTEPNGHVRYAEIDACYLSQWYPGQGAIEAALVLIALICVPIMLLGKPIYAWMEDKKKKKAMGNHMVSISTAGMRKISNFSQFTEKSMKMKPR